MKYKVKTDLSWPEHEKSCLLHRKNIWKHDETNNNNQIALAITMVEVIVRVVVAVVAVLICNKLIL